MLKGDPVEAGSVSTERPAEEGEESEGGRQWAGSVSAGRPPEEAMPEEEQVIIFDDGWRRREMPSRPEFLPSLWGCKLLDPTALRREQHRAAGHADRIVCIASGNVEIDDRVPGKVAPGLHTMPASGGQVVRALPPLPNGQDVEPLGRMPKLIP